MITYCTICYTSVKVKSKVRKSDYEKFTLVLATTTTIFPATTTTIFLAATTTVVTPCAPNPRVTLTAVWCLVLVRCSTMEHSGNPERTRSVSWIIWRRQNPLQIHLLRRIRLQMGNNNLNTKLSHILFVRHNNKAGSTIYTDIYTTTSKSKKKTVSKNNIKVETI